MRFKEFLEESGTHHAYQMRIDSERVNGRWKDVELKCPSLEELYKDVSHVPHLDPEDRNYQHLHELMDILVDYHVGSHYVEAKQVSIEDQDLDVDSFKDDVLKISYRFTAYYKEDGHYSDRPPVDHRGTVTLMPGN